MDKNIEKELKILVSKEQFNELKNAFEPLEFKTQVNTYYDSEDCIVEKRKGAMRIRSKNNTHIFTLKLFINDDLHEYECNVQENSVDALNKKEIIDLLNEHKIYGPFHPTATLKTKRAVFENEFAELCFDINYYNDMVDYEIEYEYKVEHDGYAIFNDILKKVNLKYTSNCKSKIQRALNK